MKKLDLALDDEGTSDKKGPPKGLNLALNLDSLKNKESQIADMKEKMFDGYNPNPSANRKKQMAEGAS